MIPISVVDTGSIHGRITSGDHRGSLGIRDGERAEMLLYAQVRRCLLGH